MGSSVGAVRSHLARGRDRLKAALRGSDTPPSRLAQPRSPPVLVPVAMA
jgi:hypothetical protein